MEKQFGGTVRKRRNGNADSRRILMEALEGRALLSMTAAVAPEMNFAASTVVKPAVAATVDMSAVSGNATLSGSQKSGATGTAKVNVKDVGKAAAAKGYSVTVYATTGGTIIGTSPAIGTLAVKGSVAAGGTTSGTVNIKLPTVTKNTAYTLVARVTATGDTVAANNVVKIGTVTVTPAASSSGDSVLGKIPSTLGFVQTTLNNLAGFQITSTGTFKGQGSVVAMGYSYSVFNGPGQGKIGYLTLNYTGQSVLVQLTYTGTRPDSLKGHTIVFSKTSAGTSGSFKVPSAAPLAGIPKAGLTGYFKLI